MRRFLLAIMLGCLVSGAVAETFRARVAAVFDGDTVLIVRSGHPPEKLRLLHIDAPEKEQPFGREARQVLFGLVWQRQVEVASVARDQYGRLLGEIVLAGYSINQEMVRRGYAWEYVGFNDDARYRELQFEAQRARRGLWRQSNPEPPWQWRHRQDGDTHAGARNDRPFFPGRCGRKQHCSEMKSCEEAYYYLLHCREQGLDRNGDGIPCEALCVD